MTLPIRTFHATLQEKKKANISKKGTALMKKKRLPIILHTMQEKNMKRQKHGLKVTKEAKGYLFLRFRQTKTFMKSQS